MVPECSTWDEDDGNCDDINANEHTGWTHAETWDDVVDLVAAGEEVYDRDGDRIYRVAGAPRESEPPPPGAVGEAWAYYGPDMKRYLAHPGNMLIREDNHVPVSEDELAEVMASLLGV